MDLERFVRIQDQVIVEWPLKPSTLTEYERALLELSESRKKTDWIRFIFPQIFGLGKSINSRLYGIKSIEEAQAYLAHPVLGPRLRSATEHVLLRAGMCRDGGGGGLVALFGSRGDADRFRACVSLFAQVSVGSEDEYYVEVARRLWDGRFCARTTRILEGWIRQSVEE